MTAQQDRAVGLQLSGYRLATAEITYRLPDHPDLLQTYVWQDYDPVLRFPRLCKFLGFWRQSLDGPLHSVRVCSTRLLRPAELRLVGNQLALH